jgi:hypothetical protein
VLALAGLLMYGLLRALQLSPLAAGFGAMAFAWSGTLTANGHWFQRMEPLALLPGLLWAELAIARASGLGRALPAIGFALLVMLAWTAGFPPFCIAVCVFAALFGLWLLLCELRAGGGAAASLLGWLLGAGAVGLLLAMPSLLPQLEFFRHSSRSPTPTLAKASEQTFDPCGLLGYLFPSLFSHPGDRLLPGVGSPLPWLWWTRANWETGALLRPNYNFTEYAVFPGTLTALLAVLGVVAKGPRWRFLVLVGLALALLLATGAGPFCYAFAVPVVQAVPPYRFAATACIFVAVLAGLGLQALCGDLRPALLRGLAIVAVAGGVCCLGSLSTPVSAGADDPWVAAITERYRHLAPQIDAHIAPAQVTPAMAYSLFFSHQDEDGNKFDHVLLGRQRLHDNLLRTGIALAVGGVLLFLLSLQKGQQPVSRLRLLGLVALCGVELWDFGHQLNRGRTVSPSIDTQVQQFLRQQRDQHRDDGGILVARGDAVADAPMALPPGTLAADGIRDLHFYTFTDAWTNEPLRELYGAPFLASHDTPLALPDDDRLSRPFFDAMGLRFVLSKTPMQHAGARVGPELKGPGGEFFVYERATALPRAWVVPELEIVDDDATMTQRAVKPEFAPRRQAIVTKATAEALPRLSADSQAGQRAVHFLFEDEKRLTMGVDSGPAGYLVLADTWMPGWEASIDGASVPVLRGNVYQRILPLPGKACEVRLRYRTPGLIVGLLLAAFGVLLGGALLWRAWRASRAVVVPFPVTQPR